jgi:hypothetical protein
MASWGTNRRNIILLIVFLIILILGGGISYAVFYEEPTCFDARMNGDETGIDCGGSCELLCNNQIIEPLVHWQRSFEVIPGIYNVMAYVENQNIDAGSENVEYLFELFDRNNVLLTQRRGNIEIRPREIIPILEPNLNTGELEPARVSFQFVNNIVWEKQTSSERPLVIRDERIFEDDGLPEITAEIFNSSVNTVEDIRVVVIVYDQNDNAIATSRTVIDQISKDQSERVVFTWPEQFESQFSRFEIIPLYDYEFSG